MNRSAQGNPLSRGHAISDDRRSPGGIVTPEAAATAAWWRCGLASRSGAGARLDTRRPASYGQPRCRENATCVPDPGPCEPPDGSQGSNSAPGFEPSSRERCDSRADRRGAGKKRWCRVTTRRRNLRFWNRLRWGLGLLTARAFGLGVPGFDVGALAPLGLAPCRLPTVDLPPAFRILAVALVPRPRLILASAPFAQADPRTRTARSSGTAGP